MTRQGWKEISETVPMMVLLFPMSFVIPLKWLGSQSWFDDIGCLLQWLIMAPLSIAALILLCAGFIITAPVALALMLVMQILGLLMLPFLPKE
jgi:hypothetical protein